MKYVKKQVTGDTYDYMTSYTSKYVLSYYNSKQTISEELIITSYAVHLVYVNVDM